MNEIRLKRAVHTGTFSGQKKTSQKNCRDCLKTKTKQKDLFDANEQIKKY
jgi:hypothetical protein